MGDVVFLARHGRASAGSRGGSLRDASSVKRSAVIPPALPVEESKIGCHHSDGMLSRWSHLRADATVAPISSAKAPGDRHRAITARNELMDVSVTDPDLGHSVLKVKAKLSHDKIQAFQDNPGMAERMSEIEEKLAFIKRVKDAREARFPRQEPICTILDLDQGTYKQYESRSYLPHRYIPKFCAACDVSMEWLLTGEGKGPIVPEYPREVPKRIRKPRRRKAA